MELDRTIALIQREQWEKEEKEAGQRERDPYDPKKRITYTLEELIQGIRSGKQYLYTLKLEFEPMEILKGSFRIPFIRDFYDVVENEPDSLLLVSSRRKASMSVSHAAGRKKGQPMKEWVELSMDTFRKLKLHTELDHTGTAGPAEYFCYGMPTSEGQTYNLTFRYPKGDQVFAGSLSCMKEEKDGMGLLLEALIHVTAEMNQEEGEG